jgi:hypothetical protein
MKMMRKSTVSVEKGRFGGFSGKVMGRVVVLTTPSVSYAPIPHGPTQLVQLDKELDMIKIVRLIRSNDETYDTIIIKMQDGYEIYASSPFSRKHAWDKAVDSLLYYITNKTRRY